VPSLRASPDVLGVLQCQHQSMARSVLIVGDHPGFRAQARVMLAAAGYDVVGEAADGESGVRVARELSPDVVLLDVQLPDITGFEVVRLVHGEPDPPAVVLISSRDASDYGRRVERSGAQGFIPKAELSARTLAAVLEGTGR
jgi:DNA-binding NarL/FixJ family response regulator